MLYIIFNSILFIYIILILYLIINFWTFSALYNDAGYVFGTFIFARTGCLSFSLSLSLSIYIYIYIYIYASHIIFMITKRLLARRLPNQFIKVEPEDELI